MRWIAVVAGALSLGVGFVPALRAGLYNTAEPPTPLSRNFAKFRETLIPLRGIGPTEAQTDVNRRYSLVALLAARGVPPDLTVEQRLDLNAYLVRMIKPRDAVNVLVPAQAKDRDNVLVLANLATAELLDNNPARALGYQDEAVRLLKAKEWSGLSEQRRKWLETLGWHERDYRWYREVEIYQLRLIRLRARESVRPKDGLPDDVDAIFVGEGQTPAPVRFVGESGRFEAGKLAAAEGAKLPKDAIEIVEQLVMWMPHDMRLYWLLGELFNAAGDVGAAKSIFEEVVAKWNPQAAKDKLGAGAGFARDPRQTATTGFQRDPTLPKLFKEHLDVLRAQPLPEPTVVEPMTAPAPAPAKPPQETAAPPVEWRSLGIGFGTGLLVAFFAYWQIRELRRRRQARTIVSKGLS
jgi:hypothetical protein